ncbi:hypothetical protein LCM03_00215 [Bacillus stratosphericus]|nr:hypothetical protein [Bacillus stratosphericus]
MGAAKNAQMAKEYRQAKAREAKLGKKSRICTNCDLEFRQLEFEELCERCFKDLSSY